MNELKVTPKGDREIVITREFNAPRELVYEAYTTPELLKRWLLGPDGWSLVVCDIDLRVGGKYRWVWRHDTKKTEMGMRGVYREIKAPERIVSTEKFDDAWYPGEAVGTIVLKGTAGRTMMTQTMVYESRDARDGVLKSGMETGLKASFDRLDKIVASKAVRS